MLKVVLWNLTKGVNGRYIPKSVIPGGTRIQISKLLPKDKLRETLIHELIHYICDMNDIPTNCHQEVFVTVLAINYDRINQLAIKYENELRSEICE